MLLERRKGVMMRVQDCLFTRTLSDAPIRLALGVGKEGIIYPLLLLSVFSFASPFTFLKALCISEEEDDGTPDDRTMKLPSSKPNQMGLTCTYISRHACMPSTILLYMHLLLFTVLSRLNPPTVYSLRLGV